MIYSLIHQYDMNNKEESKAKDIFNKYFNECKSQSTALRNMKSAGYDEEYFKAIFTNTTRFITVLSIDLSSYRKSGWGFWSSFNSSSASVGLCKTNHLIL